MSAYTDAQAQNDITRNVRQYKDLDLFFTKKTTTKKKATKEKSVVKEEPVVEPVAEPEPTKSTETPVVKKALTPRLDSTPDLKKVPEIKLEDNITTQLDTLLGTVVALVNQLKSVQAEVKTLQKNYVKVLKDHNKPLTV